MNFAFQQTSASASNTRLCIFSAARVVCSDNRNTSRPHFLPATGRHNHASLISAVFNRLRTLFTNRARKFSTKPSLLNTLRTLAKMIGDGCPSPAAFSRSSARLCESSAAFSTASALLCNTPGVHPEPLTPFSSPNVVPFERASNPSMTSTPGSPAIQLDRVSRHYTLGTTTIHAVDDVSLSIAGGEFVALLGSSGSGKSTLLNLMAGLDRPTSGAIHADGKNLAELSSLELARYRRSTVGMVFQSFNLLPRMTLAENVELPLRLAEVDHSERDARVAEALQRVKLEKRTGHRPAELSGGEQQRTAIARALVNRPKILFADEPTGNLDSATGESIMNLLLEIRSTLGMTIIMVTHERPLAEKFASRLAIMGDGKLLSDGATAGVNV